MTLPRKFVRVQQEARRPLGMKPILATMVVVVFSGCATRGGDFAEVLPGRHAYSIETATGHGWVEFDCESFWHPNKKIGRVTRIRSFYSAQKSFAFRIAQPDGSYNLIRLPDCKDVQLDGKFPARMFDLKNKTYRACSSPSAEDFLRRNDRSYRCWGSLEDTGFVVEYFYKSL